MNRVVLSLLFIAAPLAVVRAQDTTSAAATSPPAYFEFQVERPAVLVGGMRGVAYPPELRAQGVEGMVLVQFVVGTDGKPDMATFKVLQSPHQLFSQAVHDAVAKMRFKPGEIDGHAVRQVVHQPFTFALAR
ncbi:MAG: energy transducer TonB [Gemmatimonadaceae bacterium]